MLHAFDCDVAAARLVWAIAGLLAGLLAGSFAATLIVRWPQGLTIGGRSRCDSCARRIRVRDLVPVFSFLRLRGRCRSCGSPIPPVHIWTEVAAGAAGATALFVEPNAAGLLLACGGWLLLTLAALDFRHLWLPDALVLCLAAAGIGHALLSAPDLIAERIAGAVVLFLTLEAIRLAYLRLRRRHGLGAGDPKLAAAIAVWIGWRMLPTLILLAALGGLLMVVALRVARRPIAAGLPFGTMLAAAAWPLILLSAWE